MNIEIGGGPYPLEGFIQCGWDVPVQDPAWCRWGEQPLPFISRSVDLIYASHVLEHVPWFKTVDALREAHRVLREDGGAIEIWVPDFAYIVACYLRGECGDDWRKHNDGGDPMTWINGRLFTYGPEPNWHKATFDEAHLTRCLLAAGFARVERLDTPRGYSHGPIGLGMRGVRE